VKPLDVDFRIRRRPPPWAWVVAIAPFGAAVAAGWEALPRWLEAGRVANPTTLATPGPAAIRLADPATEAQLQAVAEHLRQARSDWPTCLRGLEATTLEGIRLKAVEVNVLTAICSAEVEYRDWQTLTAFLAQLNAGLPAPAWKLLRTDAARAATAPSDGTAIVEARIGERAPE
jgi:hypothetical protein